MQNLRNKERCRMVANVFKEWKYSIKRQEILFRNQVVLQYQRQIKLKKIIFKQFKRNLYIKRVQLYLLARSNLRIKQKVFKQMKSYTPSQLMAYSKLIQTYKKYILNKYFKLLQLSLTLKRKTQYAKVFNTLQILKRAFHILKHRKLLQRLKKTRYDKKIKIIRSKHNQHLLNIYLHGLINYLNKQKNDRFLIDDAQINRKKKIKIKFIEQLSLNSQQEQNIREFRIRQLKSQLVNYLKTIKLVLNRRQNNYNEIIKINMKYYLYQWHNKFIHINQLKIDKAMEYRNSKLKNKGIQSLVKYSNQLILIDKIKQQQRLQLLKAQVDQWKQKHKYYQILQRIIQIFTKLGLSQLFIRNKRIKQNLNTDCQIQKYRLFFLFNQFRKGVRSIRFSQIQKQQLRQQYENNLLAIIIYKWQLIAKKQIQQKQIYQQFQKERCRLMISKWYTISQKSQRTNYKLRQFRINRIKKMKLVVFNRIVQQTMKHTRCRQIRKQLKLGLMNRTFKEWSKLKDITQQIWSYKLKQLNKQKKMRLGENLLKRLKAVQFYQQKCRQLSCMQDIKTQKNVIMFWYLQLSKRMRKREKYSKLIRQIRFRQMKSMFQFLIYFKCENQLNKKMKTRSLKYYRKSLKKRCFIRLKYYQSKQREKYELEQDALRMHKQLVRQQMLPMFTTVCNRLLLQDKQNQQQNLISRSIRESMLQQKYGQKWLHYVFKKRQQKQQKNIQQQKQQKYEPKQLIQQKYPKQPVIKQSQVQDLQKTLELKLEFYESMMGQLNKSQKQTLKTEIRQLLKQINE